MFSLSSEETIHLFTIFGCCFCICGLLAGFIWSILLAMQDGLKQLKRLHQIPCNKCVYFTDDYNLKCTVRPCEALTEAAIACRDFEAFGSHKARLKLKPTLPAKNYATPTFTSTDLD
ncbi:hypothetical protein [Phormidesmis priestleyi]